MKKSKTVIKKKPIFKNISALVIDRLKKSIDYSPKTLAKEIKALFPKSAWKATHDSWYRSAFRNGRLKGVNNVY